jgi:serine/threonine-protein kinase RsbW
MREPLRAHLVLGSRLENIEVAERALLDLLAHSGCVGDDEYWMVAALREAFANAVCHGNHAEPERVVRVEYTIADRTVTIRVEDQGEGFDPGVVPNPTDRENLLRPNGRGIFYMQQFMNRVEFGRAPGGGTAVLMVKEFEPSPRSEAHEECSPRSGRCPDH